MAFLIRVYLVAVTMLEPLTLYGISLDVYVLVLAELVGALAIIGWALRKSDTEDRSTDHDVETTEVQ